MGRIGLELDGRQIEITTDRAESSYGQPVVVVDGEVCDGQPACEDVLFDHDCPGPLSQLADAAGIWGGPATRAQLCALADEMLAGIERPRGADYDRVIDEFARRGRALREIADEG